MFDRVPSMDELTLYFDFVKEKLEQLSLTVIMKLQKKNHTFFTNLKRVTKDINPLVEVITETYYEDNWAILPYADLHRKGSIEDIDDVDVSIYSCSW